MSHTSSDANIQTEDTKQGVAASASSKGTLMKPLALAKSSSADPGLSLELLNLVIRNLIHIDAQSLGRLALASRLFAALTRSYRLGLLILTNDLDCYDYMAFCETTAPDAPSLVRELHLEQFCLLDDVNQSPTTKIVPIATDVRSLSLRGDAWGNLLVPGMICTARIDTLTLCQEFFTTMAEMEGFFGNMPSLKTVVLKDEVGIQESFDAPSGGAIKEGSEISELRLVKLYNSGEFMEHVITHATPFSLRNIKRLHIHCINHGLENFLYKVFQIPGDMEELVLTRPKPCRVCKFPVRRDTHCFQCLVFVGISMLWI
ncbi:hypothetical protein CPB85DRAFT_553655 [Mucidula mucida]|nr:hypothetical protein CPB85DRAFT_553655 [Mucidula mucida]